MTENNDCPFITVALPKEIIDKIDAFIESSDHLFTSRPHVIKVALSKFFNNNCGGVKYGEMERKVEDIRQAESKL